MNSAMDDRNDVPGYHLDEKLYENSLSLIFRTRRISDNRQLLLKILKREDPSAEEKSRFVREYEMHRDLLIEGVTKAHELKEHENRYVMVLEDIAGISLRSLLDEGPMLINDFLAPALRITELVGRLHTSNVVHGEINPHNLFYSPETGHLSLLDLGSAAWLSWKSHSPADLDTLEMALAYMSPEKTGRMNRLVDCRTDLYSLGVIFYEMLTGRPPFEAKNPLELVHSHLAMLPAPPQGRNPRIPPLLSDMILKLLGKNPEDRYQSAFGLLNDLKRCSEQLGEAIQMGGFAMAGRDIPPESSIPGQLRRGGERLRASEERYALAVEGANDIIWDLNLLTDEVYHSSRYGSMLGYEETEMAGSTNVRECVERIHPDDFQRVRETVEAYLEGRLPVFKLECRLRRKDGDFLWVLIRGACARDSQGQPYRMAGSLTDISEHKKLEHQLLQSRKMESIGILAGGVAHEFNNLLTVISGFGHLIQEELPEDDEPSQEKIGYVLKAAERAAELTGSLLAFSRRQIINPVQVRVDSIIGQACKLIERIISEDVALAVDLSKETLLVMADTGQMEQVMINLAANARDAMPQGGSLIITTSKLVVKEGAEPMYDLAASGEYALVSVTDTGTGIDRESLDKIFEPFYTTKEVGKGAGLGLSIVHGIIKQHNGSILVKSEPGKGTTFDIYLPLIVEQAAEIRSTEAAPHAASLGTLLVADDEETVQTYLKTILEKAGYKVIVAANGEEGVALFREQGGISLVLSDVVMPRMNGREMLDEIRKMNPRVKALFISGYSADIVNDQGLLQERTEFISKPFKMADLLRKVREMLDRD